MANVTVDNETPDLIDKPPQLVNMVLILNSPLPSKGITGLLVQTSEEALYIFFTQRDARFLTKFDNVKTICGLTLALIERYCLDYH